MNKDNTIKYNPRFEAYAFSKKMTVEDVLAQDKKEHPVACMLNYMMFIGKKKREFTSEYPDKVRDGNILDHRLFTAFLERR
jgi:hypothetical protein